MYRKYLGEGSLLLIGLLFGLSGVIAKYLSTWLNPYQVVEYRFFIAFVSAVIVFLVSRKKLQFQKLNKQTLFLFAITLPISSILFTLAIFNSSVSLAVFAFYISNLFFSFVIGKIYFNEAITNNKKIALLFIIFAIIAFTNPFDHFAIKVGFVYGLLSGLFQTLASTFQKLVGHTTDRIGLLLTQTFSGVILSVAAIKLTGSSVVGYIPQTAVFVAIFFGVIYLLIAYLFLVGFKYVNLQVGSILVSTELFFGPFFAFILLSEKLTALELVGGIFIAIAVIYANMKEKKVATRA